MKRAHRQTTKNQIILKTKIARMPLFWLEICWLFLFSFLLRFYFTYFVVSWTKKLIVLFVIIVCLPLSDGRKEIIPICIEYGSRFKYYGVKSGDCAEKNLTEYFLRRIRTFFREAQEIKNGGQICWGLLDDWLVRSCMRSKNLTNIYKENRMESSMKYQFRAFTSSNGTKCVFLRLRSFSGGANSSCVSFSSSPFHASFAPRLFPKVAHTIQGQFSHELHTIHAGRAGHSNFPSDTSH